MPGTLKPPSSTPVPSGKLVSEPIPSGKHSINLEREREWPAEAGLDLRAQPQEQQNELSIKDVCWFLVKEGKQRLDAALLCVGKDKLVSSFV